MHEKSLPVGDRTDAAAATADAPVDQRAALVIGVERGKYFKAWRNRGGGHFAVQNVARARLFSPHAHEILDATLAKLRRNHVKAAIVEVSVIVGHREMPEV